MATPCVNKFGELARGFEGSSPLRFEGSLAILKSFHILVT